MTPGDRAGHLQQATPLWPPVASLLILLWLLSLFLPPPSPQSVHNILTQCGDSPCRLATLLAGSWLTSSCRQAGVYGPPVPCTGGRCLSSSPLGLHGGRQGSVSSMAHPCCGLESRSVGSFTCLNHVAWKKPGLCLSSSSCVVLSGFDSI